jgi:glycosyltransferase involved in cell wall biosynthesis
VLDQFRRLGYPEIQPVPVGVYRPLWSVMIPTYNCAALLRETLKSVLAQDPGFERMQIEVVDDASTKDDPEAVVRELGQGRVAFHRHPKNIGATANFNICLSRSQGILVHILHGDDLVLPGFYDRMRGLLDQNRGAGSAFCRFIVIDKDGLWNGLSKVMQRTSGLYPGALATLASENLAQFAAVVLRRSLVEAVGGFHPSLVHAADWDLWKRAALHQPVAHEPSTLACYRVFEGNDTSKLVRSGANTADLRRAIDLSTRYLTHPESASWITNARRHYANCAKHCAMQMSAVGDYEAFRNQVREACLLEPGFYWSREHCGLRYRSLKQWLKQRLLARKGWFSRNRLLKVEAGPAST